MQQTPNKTTPDSQPKQNEANDEHFEKQAKLAHSDQAHLISEYFQNTFLRPSAIIGGSALLIIGNLYLIYASNKYGYNFGAIVSFWLFITGYFLGFFSELLYRTYKKHSH
jgi:hypothetical protein